MAYAVRDQPPDEVLAMAKDKKDKKDKDKKGKKG
jgi:hypothetical protein